MWGLYVEARHGFFGDVTDRIAYCRWREARKGLATVGR